jgi:SAM-dependent methyltransferase
MTEAHTSYDPQYFDVLSHIDDRHFWFRTRNQLIHTLAKQIVAGFPSGYKVLEVGCGNGNVLRWLAAACPSGVVVGMDLFAEGLSCARKRADCPLVLADIHRAPFSNVFDLIGLFDVLEHLEDDCAVLESIRSLLSPKGALLLTVPANPALWSHFDESAHHCRRYDHRELGEKLLTAGFDVEFLTPYMASILPLLYAGRKLASKMRTTVRQTSEYDLKIVPGVNEVLAFLLRQESRIVAARRVLPFGASLLAIARNHQAGD